MPQIIGSNMSVANRLVPSDGLLVTYAEHFDEFILDWQMKHPSVWRDLIPKGKFPLFNGSSQKSYIFRGSLGPQDGLTEWADIEPTRKPSGDDLGNDPCQYTPNTYTWGWDAIDFRGLKTSWKSPNFCVQDLKFQDKAAQQLNMITKAGVMATDQIKETFHREKYMQLAAQAGKFVVYVDGLGLDYLSNATLRVTYDPFTKTDGKTTISFAVSLLPRISTLNWSGLDLIKSYLSDQCPDAAQKMDGGMPVFGLMIDMQDFEKMVYADPELREDFRYSRPQLLVEGFNMGFKVYRGFALMHDVRQARYTLKSVTSTVATAERVTPRIATRPGSVAGTVPEANPAYQTAELGTAVIFLNKVMQVLIPDPINSLASGMVFGPAPDFNGNWMWINNKTETNPLGETGYFFSRYEYFTKILEYAQEATVILYRRCPHTLGTGCAAEKVTAAENSSTLVAAPAAGDFDATNRTVVLSLTNRLAAGVGDTVTIDRDGNGTTFTATIASDDTAPVYKFMWAAVGSVPTEVAHIEADATVTVA